MPSTLRSVRRKGTETHVTPEGVYKTDSSGPAWRCAVTGVRATVSNTRGQPREAGSLSRLFGSVETTAKRVSMGHASVKRVREGQSLTVKQFQRLLGLMAAASNVIPFGLLYMRPLQWWLKTKGFSPRGNPLRMIKVSRRCVRALDMWRKPWFLNQGPVLGAPCRQLSLATDASLTGWGAVCGVVAISYGTSIVWRC